MGVCSKNDCVFGPAGGRAHTGAGRKTYVCVPLDFAQQGFVSTGQSSANSRGNSRNFHQGVLPSTGQGHNPLAYGSVTLARARLQEDCEWNRILVA